MKARGKKFLSTLIVIIMVLSTSVLPVLADDSQADKPQGLQLYANTENSIVLSTEDDYKYAIQTGADESLSWQWADDTQYDKESNTVSFTGLKADTPYTFARIANDADKIEDTDIQTYKTKAVTQIDAKLPDEDLEKEPLEKEPPEKESVEKVTEPKTVATPKNTVKATTPPVPQIESKSDTTIKFALPDGIEELFKDGYTLYFSKDGGNAFEVVPEPYKLTGLTAGTTYSYYAVIKAGTYEGTKYLESDPTETLTVQTLNTAAAAPDAPTVADRTDTSITLDAKDNQEFAIVDGSTIGKWQTSPEFTGLTPNTEYTFITRASYNPEAAMESLASEKTTVKTVIAFAGSTITGITANAVYTPGTALTAVAVGSGMDNANPSPGDTRWVPDSWYWNSKTVTKWDKAPYSIPFTLKAAGNYKLTVSYRLEGYDDETWNDLEKTETASVAFKVEAPAVTKYTIAATSGTGGKISPSGNVGVEKGKNAEFTFTPDKNYQVSKVTVDGKVVKVKNNKYVFENVTSDHKISVAFEKINKAVAAKTGDNTMLPFWIGAIISGCFIVLLIAYKKAKQKG